MKNDDYVTRKELDSERHLTKVEMSERIFLCFYSVIFAVHIALLTITYASLFELVNQVP